jgi:hypothetical protein
MERSLISSMFSLTKSCPRHIVCERAIDNMWSSQLYKILPTISFPNKFTISAYRSNVREAAINNKEGEEHSQSWKLGLHLCPDGGHLYEDIISGMFGNMY